MIAIDGSTPTIHMVVVQMTKSSKLTSTTHDGCFLKSDSESLSLFYFLIKVKICETSSKNVLPGENHASFH